MEPKGYLADRALAAVLLELAEREDTGVLRIEKDEGLAEIFLERGLMYGLRWHERPPNARLGQMLLRTRAVSVAQLQECLQQQDRTLRRLGEILVDFGYATKAQVAEAARQQAMESVTEFLTWTRGSFQFFRGGNPAISHDFAPIELVEWWGRVASSTFDEAGLSGSGRALARRAPKREQIVEFCTTMGLYGVIVLGCALALQLQLLERFNLFRGPKPLMVESDAARHAVAGLVMARLERALEIYRWLEGHYPEQLDDLVRAGLVAASDLHYPFHSTYEYATTQNSYELHVPLR